MAWVQIPDLPFPNYIAFGKLLSHSVPQSPYLETGMISVHLKDVTHRSYDSTI